MTNTIKKQRQYLDLWKKLAENSETEISFNVMDVFTMVCESPGISMRDIVDKTGISYAGISKVISNLSTGGYKTVTTKTGDKKKELKEGLGLLTVEKEMYDKRKLELELSDKGKAFAAKIDKVLDK